ncbi:MAG: hypothetical protein WC622_02700 [Pedobacter sp.]|jgi:hypothetical protein|uniref:hypothetical protein n=1 Tax=Pedobacter sp. TaxID=1411316 RepID=UPI0035640D9E
MASTSAAPASFFTDHARKDLIRKLWCKPLIKALSDTLKKKLIYIGLPDIEALDVLEWIDYLDKVIAFQCSSYKKGEVIDVAKLDDLLQKLERQDKIKSGFVYQGWMEDIVMGGLSERGQTYAQNDFLKIYNLDFCSNILVPRQVLNEQGKVIKYITKLDVIDKFLEYELVASNDGKGEKFIMYITVNTNSFDEDLSAIKDACIKKYLKKISAIKKPEVLAVRHLKAYCYSMLSERFRKYDFHVEFLPPVFYHGSSYPNRDTGKLLPHRMMTFTILGTRRKDAEQLYVQDCEKFLNDKFIFATDKVISCFNDEKYITENDYDPDIQKIIAESYSSKTLWSRA